MRAAIVISLLAASFLLMADGAGVTSRVRITADESNRNWEQNFFGDRLRAMEKTDETADDLLTPDADTVERQQKGTAIKAPPLKGKRTIEYHIIQEESEEGDSSRKVKKRVIIEKELPDAPAPQK